MVVCKIWKCVVLSCFVSPIQIWPRLVFLMIITTTKDFKCRSVDLIFFIRTIFFCYVCICCLGLIFWKYIFLNVCKILWNVIDVEYFHHKLKIKVSISQPFIICFRKIFLSWSIKNFTVCKILILHICVSWSSYCIILTILW